MSVRDQLRGLLERHTEWLDERVDEISGRLEAEGDVAASDLSRVLQLTHQISGTSGSMGFADVSAAAAALEHRIKDAIALDACDRDVMIGLLDVLKATCAKVTPEASALYGGFPGLTDDDASYPQRKNAT